MIETEYLQRIMKPLGVINTVYPLSSHLNVEERNIDIVDVFEVSMNSFSGSLHVTPKLC